MFRLKALAPEKYRENVKVHNDTANKQFGAAKVEKEPFDWEAYRRESEAWARQFYGKLCNHEHVTAQNKPLRLLPPTISGVEQSEIAEESDPHDYASDTVTYVCNRWPEYSIGSSVRFRGGVFKTADTQLQALLENNEAFGVQIFRQDQLNNGQRQREESLPPNGRTDDE
jgi:hypothetical protein